MTMGSSAWLTAGLLAGAFGMLSWLERRRPLRPSVEPGPRHTARNLTMAALDAVAIRLTESHPARWMAVFVEHKGWGLVKMARMPRWLEFAAALLLLDYTLYLWHVLTHRVPFLWRFHLIHHVDLDMDASTAVRFHFGEMILSVVFRLGQIVLIGVTPASLAAWQAATLCSVLFHHSNLRLPDGFERRLNWILVGPRMHGIHHHAAPAETNSNWSSGLTIWDRLHGTLRLDAPDEQIDIGVPAYRKVAELTLGKLLIMPLTKQRPAWHPYPAAERALPASHA